MISKIRIAAKYRAQFGFSAIELVVALLIFGVIAGSAVPVLKPLKDSFERQDTRATVEFDLRRARAEAMALGTRTILTIAADGKSYSIGRDNLPYDTTTGNADSIFYTTTLPNSVTISLSSGSKVIFNSHGFLSDISGGPRTVTLTITLNSNGSAYSTATLYPIGVARFTG